MRFDTQANFIYTTYCHAPTHHWLPCQLVAEHVGSTPPVGHFHGRNYDGYMQPPITPSLKTTALKAYNAA